MNESCNIYFVIQESSMGLYVEALLRKRLSRVETHQQSHFWLHNPSGLLANHVFAHFPCVGLVRCRSRMGYDERRTDTQDASRGPVGYRQLQRFERSALLLLIRQPVYVFRRLGRSGLSNGLDRWQKQVRARRSDERSSTCQQVIHLCTF